MSLGLDAPQARTTRSYSRISCSAFTSLPMSAPVTKATPSSSITLRFLSTTRFSSFMLGIPYINSPPMRSKRSYTVTQWPLLFSRSAAARPAGPLPTTATFFPVRTLGGWGPA